MLTMAGFCVSHRFGGGGSPCSIRGDERETTMPGAAHTSGRCTLHAHLEVGGQGSSIPLQCSAGSDLWARAKAGTKTGRRDYL